MSTFKIWCEVSGGLFGNRAAYLKQNGVERIFLNREDAERVAGELHEKNNGNPHRTADFRYTVEEQ